MKHIKNSGFCPQCNLIGEEFNLILNRADYWECPNCRLQLQTVSDEHLGILMERGNKEFKPMVYEPDRHGIKILIRKPLFKEDDCIIKNTDELKEYLKMTDY